MKLKFDFLTFHNHFLMTASFSRLVVPQIRPRSLSPVAELNNGNKRPASICDFFAKGWCIKGNSCRFLHIKDDGNITSPKPEGDIAALAEKSELQAGGGNSIFLWTIDVQESLMLR